PDHRKNLLVFLITIPFWTNLLVRTFAWVIILGRGGFMDQVGSFLNIIGPDESINLMYTNTAILIGLVYSYLPLMVLPLYSSMEKMDVRLLEAGADLYANRFELIRRIILPLTMPGIIGGSILVFVPCLGAFIAPDLLGGGKKLMLGSLVQLQFATSRNWPFGAAIAMMLLAIVVIALMLNARAARRHAAYEQGGAEVTHG
ncbi:MAG: ABC transporter permease, partial [Candidatus Puniceispirillum sp.]